MNKLSLNSTAKVLLNMGQITESEHDEILSLISVDPIRAELQINKSMKSVKSFRMMHQGAYDKVIKKKLKEKSK